MLQITVAIKEGTVVKFPKHKVSEYRVVTADAASFKPQYSYNSAD